MTDFHPASPSEAHPTRDEYVIERALNHGRWVVESIRPHPTPEAAVAERARLLDNGSYQQDTFRVVRRTITSTVIAVRTNPEGTQP